MDEDQAERIAIMLLQVALADMAVEMRIKARDCMMDWLKHLRREEIHSRVKRVFKPHARQFTLNYLNSIRTATTRMKRLPVMIKTFPEQLNPIMGIITDHLVRIFSSRLELQDEKMSNAVLATRDRAIVRILRETIAEVLLHVRGNERNEFVSRMEPVVGCVLQIIRKHMHNIRRYILMDIYNLLLALTDISAKMDVFRTFEPLCELLKNNSLGNISPAPLLTNYIKSEVFAHSIERNARLVLHMYQEQNYKIGNSYKANYDGLKLLLVRLDPSATNEILVEEILKFVIEKEPIRHNNYLTSECFDICLTGFCYHRDSMIKISDFYSITTGEQTGEKSIRERMYELFMSTWLSKV